MTPRELLDRYDDEVRRSFPHRLPPHWTVERDGPLARCTTGHGGFAMLVEDAAALSTTQLASLVDRTFAAYADLGCSFEWKTFDHDREDLIPMLVARGAQAESPEALVLGETARLAGEVELDHGLVLRETDARADLDRIEALLTDVWGTDHSYLADDLEQRLASSEPITVVLIEDGPELVCAAWLVPHPGTSFAGLWGGSTRASHRGRGSYRAITRHRANLAQAAGYSLLQVDASPDSRPILERLGLVVAGGTTPYVTAAPPTASRSAG